MARTTGSSIRPCASSTTVASATAGSTGRSRSRATDDPDKVEVAADPSRKIEHTYTATGRRGGAIHRITEHYAKLLRAYDANDDDEASYQLGMLAHFYGDLSMPYHTDQAAQEADGEHEAYEHARRRPDEGARPTQPGWSVANTSWNVSNMPNVRTAAVALAAYSRARYTRPCTTTSSANDTVVERRGEERHARRS